MILTVPLSASVGGVPFITIGELGANLEYLGIMSRGEGFGFLLLECVEVDEGVAHGVGEDQLLKVIHKGHLAPKT